MTRSEASALTVSAIQQNQWVMDSCLRRNDRTLDCAVKNDQFVKSLLNLSFRAKREIFILQPIEKIRFLPAACLPVPGIGRRVEMTDSLRPLNFVISRSINDEKS